MTTLKIPDTNLDHFYAQNPNFDILSVYFHNPSELSQLETQLKNAGVAQTDIEVRSPPPLLALVPLWLRFPSKEGLGVGRLGVGQKPLPLSLL